MNTRFARKGITFVLFFVFFVSSWFKPEGAPP